MDSSGCSIYVSHWRSASVTWQVIRLLLGKPYKRITFLPFPQVATHSILILYISKSADILNYSRMLKILSGSGNLGVKANIK